MQKEIRSMKPNNLIITDENGRLLYIGEGLVPGIVKKRPQKLFGYGAGRLDPKDSFVVFSHDVSGLAPACRKALEKACDEILPQNGAVIAAGVYPGGEVKSLIKVVEKSESCSAELLDTVFHGQRLIISRIFDDAKRSTDLFKESLNLETSEAVRQLREYSELINIKNKTNSQVERLKDLTEELTSKYPQYIDKLRQELTLKGKISQATAEQIANEMTLAKVKQLQNKKDDIDKQVAAQQRAYRFSNTFAAARFGTPIDTTSGRQGVRKYLQIQQDELKKQLKAAKDNRQKIIKELTFSYDDYSLAPSTGGLGGGSDKKGREKRQLTISEKLQKSYNDEYRRLQDLATQGITSGKVWDSQVAKVNNLSAALERVKQATDLSVIPPFQALNTEIQKAQERVNNLAASKRHLKRKCLILSRQPKQARISKSRTNLAD